MEDASNRFGGSGLKSVDRTVKIDDNKVDRSKASIFAWDDAKLQETAIVKKKVTKAATSIQRFIRACISHWQYYNEERIPLEEELKDIERRRLEEVIEVLEFKQRGYEEARFDLEAEMAMPKEEFDKCQKLSKELKAAIKEEEQAIVEIEKETTLEKQHTKKLGREKHEIDARHTLSRLDVEIPALEGEQKELKEVDDEFTSILAALQAQLYDMEGSLQIEIRHKRRLIRCIALMMKALESGGIKAKILNSLKLIIKYKGEDPPPKPAPVPVADAIADATSETDPTESTTAQEKAKVSVDEEALENKDVSEATAGSTGSGSGGQPDVSESTNGDSEGVTKSLRRGKKNPTSKSTTAKAREAPAVRSVKKNMSTDDIKKCVRSSQNGVPPLMDWKARRKCVMRSMSGPRDEQPVSKSRAREDEVGFSWADMQDEQQQKLASSKIPPRSKSDSTELKVDKKALIRASKNSNDKMDGSKKTRDKSKDKDKGRRKKERDMRRSKSDLEKKSERKGRRTSDSDIAKDGVFSWAFHAKK